MFLRIPVERKQQIYPFIPRYFTNHRCVHKLTCQRKFIHDKELRVHKILVFLGVPIYIYRVCRDKTIESP